MVAQNFAKVGSQQPPKLETPWSCWMSCPNASFLCNEIFLFLISSWILSCFYLWLLSDVLLPCTSLKTLALSSQLSSLSYWKVASPKTSPDKKVTGVKRVCIWDIIHISDSSPTPNCLLFCFIASFANRRQWKWSVILLESSANMESQSSITEKNPISLHKQILGNNLVTTAKLRHKHTDT